MLQRLAKCFGPPTPPAVIMSDTKIPNEPPPDYAEAAPEQASVSRPTGPIRRPMQPLDLPIIKHLNSKRVVLASASPRRKALLQQVFAHTVLIQVSNC
jgi:hypothetical protein